MSPPTDLHPAVADSPLQALAAVALPLDRWTARSTPTASSVRAVGMFPVEAEAPVLVLAESCGSRLDVLLPVASLGGNFDITNKCLPQQKAQTKGNGS
jgi:hypothetical protein